jgi:hypothetical protein
VCVRWRGRGHASKLHPPQLLLCSRMQHKTPYLRVFGGDSFIIQYVANKGRDYSGPIALDRMNARQREWKLVIDRARHCFKESVCQAN